MYWAVYIPLQQGEHTGNLLTWCKKAFSLPLIWKHWTVSLGNSPPSLYHQPQMQIRHLSVPAVEVKRKHELQASFFLIDSTVMKLLGSKQLEHLWIDTSSMWGLYLSCISCNGQSFGFSRSEMENKSRLLPSCGQTCTGPIKVWGCVLTKELRALRTHIWALLQLESSIKTFSMSWLCI